MTERYALPGDVQLREHAYVTRVYLARTDEGEDLETVLQPGFWVQCAKPFRIRDVLEIIADDGSFEWHGRVVRKGEGEVHFRELFRWCRGAATEAEPSPQGEYRIAWNGPAHKFRVLSPGGRVLKIGLADKAEAQDWLRRYLDGEIRDAA